MNNALTTEERNRLEKWTSGGNDPADNPWYMTGEDGRPLNFIAAWRTMLELESQHVVH